MRLTIPLSLFMALSACSAGKTGKDTHNAVDSGVENGITPVYITLVGHVEDYESLYRCPKWSETRAGLLSWAEAIAPYTNTFNLQIDYPFISAMADCERAEDRSETGEVNVLQYLQDHYGWELDPHQEGGYEGADESPDDYADVHWILSRVVSDPSDTVGGFAWNNERQFERMQSGYNASRLHGHAWKPELLTMAVHSGHHGGDFEHDDNTSGIWHPSDTSEIGFRTHDDERRLPYIGTGLQHSNWSGSDACDFDHTIEYAEVVAEMMGEGKVPSNQIYTASLAFPSSVMLDEEKYARALEMLSAAQVMADEGRAVIASYRTVIDIWRTSFSAQPNVFTYDQIDPNDYTCGD